LLAIVCVLASLAASQALAHAALIASEPADGAVVAASPPALALTFNEPVSALALKLIDPAGRDRVLPNPAGRHERIELRLPDSLVRGTHALSWRVISLDGHPVGGTVIFSVGEPSTQARDEQSRTDVAVSRSLWLARLVIYIALFVGVGGSFFRAWIERFWRHLPFLRPLCGSGIAIVGTAVGLQGLDALGLPLSHIADPNVWRVGAQTTFGATALIAAIALAMALVSLASRSRLTARTASSIGLIATGFALAASGHASAASPQLLMRPAVLVHGIAVGFWLGSLLPLAIGLTRSTGVAPLLRFSRAIPWTIVALIVSGLALAVVQVGEPHALLTTAYGRILCMKLLLVALLLTFAAVNRYRLTAAVIRDDPKARRRLGLVIAVELGIALGILGLVASWRFTPPPRALETAARAPALLHIHTARAMADIRIEPGRSGIVRASIGIMTGDFDSLEAKEVQLTVENRAAGLEAISRPALKGADAIWRVEGLPIPAPGRWDVRLDILIDDFHKIVLEDRVEIPR